MRKIKEEFCSANILGLELEHNGFQGGDAGHGGYVRIKLINEGSTAMEVNDEYVDFIEFTFRGDTERQTLLMALKTIVFELEMHQYPNI